MVVINPLVGSGAAFREAGRGRFPIEPFGSVGRFHPCAGWADRGAGDSRTRQERGGAFSWLDLGCSRTGCALPTGGYGFVGVGPNLAAFARIFRGVDPSGVAGI